MSWVVIFPSFAYLIVELPSDSHLPFLPFLWKWGWGLCQIFVWYIWLWHSHIWLWFSVGMTLQALLSTHLMQCFSKGHTVCCYILVSYRFTQTFAHNWVFARDPTVCCVSGTLRQQNHSFCAPSGTRTQAHHYVCD